MKAANALPGVSLEELPRPVLHTFGKQIRGSDGTASKPEIPRADLSHVDKPLVETLLPFQQEGIKYVIQLYCYLVCIKKKQMIQ